MSGGFRSRSKRSPSNEPQSRSTSDRSVRKDTPARKDSSVHNNSPARKDPRNQWLPGETQARRRRGETVEDAARQAALAVIRAVRADGAFANIALSQELRNRRLSKQDAAFATELAHGTVRAQGVLDAVIEVAAQRSVSDIEGELLDIVRLGTYQLLQTRVPHHAAVATSTELARAERGQGAAGFVNAVLRAVSRRTPEEWHAECCPSAESDPLGAVAFTTAHPRWIAEAFAQALNVPVDSPELEQALAADDDRPRVHVVAFPGYATAEEVALMVGGEVGSLSPYAVILTEGGDPGRLDVIKEGFARVQDEGSQLVALTLVRAPVDGEDNGRWLDLCAGPGGKAALLGAEAALCGAHVTAIEPYPHRADLVRTAVQQFPVTVEVADGREVTSYDTWDRILVDAPCSGLGSLRRRSESRWRREPADLDELISLQQDLLRSAAQLVRPGGVIAYSTCSPHVAETREVVQHISEELGLEIIDAAALWPTIDLGDKDKFVQLWPHRHGTDAMFVSLLKRPIDDNSPQ